MTVAAPTNYGQIITGNAVEQAVKATIEKWIDNYLGAIERVEGYPAGTIERPRGVVTASEFEKWPEDQIPVVLIVSGGTGKPEKHAQGRYAATWGIAVAPIVSDLDQAETRRLALAYAAAIRALMLQQRALASSLHPDGFAGWLRWDGETYTDLAHSTTRTLGTARVLFTVGVERVVEQYEGPLEPYTNPAETPPTWPTATSIKVGAHPVGIAGEGEPE